MARPRRIPAPAAGAFFAVASLLRLLFPLQLVPIPIAAAMSAGTTGASPPQQHPPLGSNPPTVVVAGATGRVGSRLVRCICSQREEGSANVVALVRNATKARELLLCADSPTGSAPSSLSIIEADYADEDSVESAFQEIAEQSGGGDIRLFLACGNVPNQAGLEKNVARAAARHGASFCAKLSTASPVLEAKAGGPYADHLEVEEALLRGGGSSSGGNAAPLLPSAMLRPNLFMQVLAEPNPLLSVNLRDSDETAHPLADKAISMIDCSDVAECAASILLCRDPASDHGGSTYELTGPGAVRIDRELADAISSMRPRRVRIASCEPEARCADMGMPPAVGKGISAFLGILGTYDRVTPDVESLTGRRARSVSDFVRADPAPFLPRTYRKLVGSRRAPSFREAAREVHDASLDDELNDLDPDEVLIRVQAAGVNGGADTFACTRAADDARDFPLGNEGAGIVVAKGLDVSDFRIGDTAVFVAGGGYAEYVRAKGGRCVNASRLCPDASPAELTSLRISALTALVALERTAGIKRGDTVLVTACCGGTGHFALQIAKNAGGTVIGTVGSSAKAQTALDLGANRVIDTSSEDVADVLSSEFPGGLDIVYDGVGGSLLRAAHDNLAEGGRILVVGSISQYPHNKADEVESHGVDNLGDIMEIFRSGQTVELDGDRKVIGNVWGDLFGSTLMTTYRDRVFELHKEGKLRALVDSKLFGGIGSVCDAVEHMLSRQSIGKVCVIISE